MTAPAPSERLDEFAWLTSFGVWPETAAQRTGWANLRGVERAARRHQRDDVLNLLCPQREGATT